MRKSITGGLVCLLGVLVLAPSFATAAKSPQDVFVTNGAADAVPVAPQGTTQVAGNVGITGTPGVQAKQDGEWGVLPGLPARPLTPLTCVKTAPGMRDRGEPRSAETYPRPRQQQPLSVSLP